MPPRSFSQPIDPRALAAFQHRQQQNSGERVGHPLTARVGRPLTYGDMDIGPGGRRYGDATISPDTLNQLAQLGWTTQQPPPDAPMGPVAGHEAPLAPPPPGPAGFREAPHYTVSGNNAPAPASQSPSKVEGVFQQPQPQQPAQQQYPNIPTPMGQGMGGPARTQPAQNLSTIAPETRAQGLGALQEEKEANLAEAQAEKEGSDEEAAQAGREAAQYASSSVEHGISERSARHALQSHLDRQAAMDAEAASGKVDPDRWLKKLGTGGNILAALAVGAGAFASINSHGQVPNYAQQIIDDAVNKDIDAQKDEISQKRHAAEAHRSLYADKLQLLGDPNAAEAAAKADQFKMYGALAKKQAAETNSNILAAKYKQIAATSDAKAAEYNQATHQYVQARLVGGPGASDTAKKVAKADEIAGHLVSEGMAPNEARMRAYASQGIIPGQGLGGFTKPGQHAPEQQKAQDQVREYDNALDKLHQMEAMIRQGGQANRARTAQGQSLVGAATNEIARAETGGTRAPSESEQAIIRQQIPKDPNAYQFTGADLAKIQTTIRNIEAERRRAAAAAGMDVSAPAAGPSIRPAGQ